jgi:hypothetical protein
MVLDSVDPRVPAGATPEVMRAARHVVTLNTAILVESGNWGDQIETNEARVALWERLLAAHEATLTAAVEEETEVVSPSAYAITTGLDTPSACVDSVGRVYRTNDCWPWTSY